MRERSVPYCRLEGEPRERRQGDRQQTGHDVRQPIHQPRISLDRLFHILHVSFHELVHGRAEHVG